MSNKTSVLRFVLITCSLIIILAIAGIIGLYGAVFPGPAALEITEFHPFRSEAAQENFLAIYDDREGSWPVPFESRRVETSFGSTYVRISGPEDSPVIVLLHGFGGNSLQWIPNVAELSRLHRVYAVDTIDDNGRSIYIQPMESAADYVLWLDEVFTGLALGGEVDLVGLSFGGWIASQYALSYPGRLHKIVLLAPAGTVLPISSEWIRRAMVGFLPHRYFAKSFLYWLLEDYVQQDEESRQMVDAWVEEAYIAGRSFKPRSMVSPNVLSNSELQQIRVPTLFLVGENEKIYSAHQAVGRLNLVAPAIETEIIPNAGHDLTMVQAEVVNSKILDFLEKP